MIFFANGPFATPAVTYIGPRCRRWKTKCQSAKFIHYRNFYIRPTQTRVTGGSTPTVICRCWRRACFLGGGGAALSSPRTGDRDFALRSLFAVVTLVFSHSINIGSNQKCSVVMYLNTFGIQILFKYNYEHLVCI